MKINISYLTISWLMIFSFSCGGNEGPDSSVSKLIFAFKQSSEQKISLYNNLDEEKYSFEINKKGENNTSSTKVEIRSMSEDELISYSKKVSRTYKLLPESFYTIKDPILNFNKEDKSLQGSIIFKSKAINDLLKNDKSNYVLPLILVCPTDSVDSKSQYAILVPDLITPEIKFMRTDTTLSINNNETTCDLQLILPFESTQDFECTIQPNTSDKPEGYNVIPYDNYSIANNGKITFKKGQKISEPLRITFKNNDIAGSSNILPLRIADSSIPGFTFPENDFIIYTLFNKINLSANMLFTNAQELSEGPLSNLVDNNSSTYFQSSYSYNSEAHYIQIHLKNAISIFGFDYQNRNNSGSKPQDIIISVSNDGTKWIDISEISSGLPVALSSRYSSSTFFSFTPVTYLKFTVKATNTGSAPTNFSLAEFTLYGK